jgi:hypothetical protein
MVDIVGRGTWGARYSRGFAAAPLPAKELYLHHSVTRPPADDLAAERAAMRQLEDIGQSRFGGGISYTFAVMPSGRIYEGHGIDRRGAHTGGRNSIARAIVLPGDHSRTRPTEAQLNAVAALIRHGRAVGWWTVDRLTGGHRNAPKASTSCPGDAAYACIPVINSRALSSATLARPTDLEDDDVSPELEKMIREIHRETATPLPNRRGPRGEALLGADGKPWADTMFGYAMNTDGSAYRNAWAIDALHDQVERLAATVAALAERVALGPAAGPSADDVAGALLRQITSGRD